MDRNQLIAILAGEVKSHVWDQADSKAYFLKDEERQMYAAFLVSVTNPRESAVIVAAHIEGDQVIIDTDLTDRPLRKALLEAGIPINQIGRANSTTPSLSPFTSGHGP